MFVDTESLQFTVEHETSDWCTRSINQSWFIMFGYVRVRPFGLRLRLSLTQLCSVDLCALDRNRNSTDYFTISRIDFAVSLLLALLSLIFLLKISPGGRDPPPPPPGPIASDDYVIVYDVTLALCALSLSLNLCCLLVCALQFLFSVKLLRAAATPGR